MTAQQQFNTVTFFAGTLGTIALEAVLGRWRPQWLAPLAMVPVGERIVPLSIEARAALTRRADGLQSYRSAPAGALDMALLERGEGSALHVDSHGRWAAVSMAISSA